jgi:hypothetical protein
LLIFKLLQSKIILLILIIIISIFFVYQIIKKRFSIKRILFISVIVGLGSYLLIVAPFYRGESIDRLLLIGNRLVNCINEYKAKHNDIPNSINDIYPICLDENEIEYIKNSVEYKFDDFEVINQKNRNDKGFTPLTENSFQLSIRHEILKPEYYYWDFTQRKFILTD